MFKKVNNIHFVGIGGSGMSGIAEVLINLGHKVSGSDLKRSETTDYLKDIGAKIFIGHRESNAKNAQVLVTSTAVGKDNPEVLFALKNKIPIIRRIEMLAELARMKYCITIAGTHGKTTTTSMTALVLAQGGLDPTIVVGGRLKNLNTSARLGRGQYLVAEADESDGSFLSLSPAVTVVTNIDNDHLDYYHTMENLKEAFIKHINSIPFYGAAIICTDDKIAASIVNKIKRKYISYGFNKNADLRAEDIKVKNLTTTFNVLYNGKKIGKIALKIPGLHNVLNSLASIGVGLWLGIPFNLIAKGLLSFDGVKRRLELKGSVNDITIIDDYGHHPTEVKASIEAIKHFFKNKKLIVLFQPHRFTRTQNLFKEFGKSFDMADKVFVMDIYPAGEAPIKNVNSDLILNELKKNNVCAQKYSDASALKKELSAGDIVLTLGAGDVFKQGEKLLTLL
ncbi:MAG: UDP-N-acetylmuramate--L-alanine ligase [Elusimicrobiota bacterium]|jgi:UDP-N-acetylmuramate--alanine ligase|nr:UDP-N-acetylmuramate--L-alanine ligase [Elusimicrobiota bacterium]